MSLTLSNWRWKAKAWAKANASSVDVFNPNGSTGTTKAGSKTASATRSNGDVSTTVKAKLAQSTDGNGYPTIRAEGDFVLDIDGGGTSEGAANSTASVECSSSGSSDWTFSLDFFADLDSPNNIKPDDRDFKIVLMVGNEDESAADTAKLTANWSEGSEQWSITGHYYNSGGTKQNVSTSVSGFEGLNGVNYTHYENNTAGPFTLLAYVNSESLNQSTSYHSGPCYAKLTQSSGDSRADYQAGGFIDMTNLS